MILVLLPPVLLTRLLIIAVISDGTVGHLHERLRLGAVVAAARFR